MTRPNPIRGRAPALRRRQAGLSMIEVLVSLLIVLVGLLGLAGLQIRVRQAEMESYQRAQALILMQDMADRIAANRPAARCYAFSIGGAPFVGTDSDAPACAGWGTAETRARADADVAQWHDVLWGRSEQSAGGQTIGAMVGARGCVSFNAATNSYTVSVAWQGIAPTSAPADPCATGMFGDDARRRVVNTSLTIAALN